MCRNSTNGLTRVATNATLLNHVAVELKHCASNVWPRGARHCHSRTHGKLATCASRIHANIRIRLASLLNRRRVIALAAGVSPL